MLFIHKPLILIFLNADAFAVRYPPVKWAKFSFGNVATRTNNIIESFHHTIKSEFGVKQKVVFVIANLHAASKYWEKNIAVLDQERTANAGSNNSGTRSFQLLSFRLFLKLSLFSIDFRANAAAVENRWNLDEQVAEAKDP